MFLNRIVNCKKEEISQRKSKYHLREYREMIKDVPATRDFKKALKQEDRISLVSEIKKASPSKGDLMPGLNPLEISGVYEQNGAAAISVLTERFFFKGSLEDLEIVSSNVTLPVLQKDFIVDVFQIYEARANKADAILLITAILGDNELTDYLGVANELGLSAIVEVHTEEEMNRALDQKLDIVGINNRDLVTFDTDLNTTIEFASLIDRPDIIKLSESGINTKEDVEKLKQAGVDAILVGEALVMSDDIPGKIKELISV